MKTEDTVEYNSLKWVKKELDLILQEAQTSFSAYIEDPEGESDRLNECIEHLHMVQGTLQMVELFGAAQLAEEMEHVAQALADGEIDKKDDAYDVLMRAMLQLPDYLESLQAGSKDVPMILLPLLNDLRASRHASLLSENVLFFPNVDVSDDSEQFAAVEKGRLLPMAKKLRPHYQVGLLGWFKGQKIAASLKRILAVLSELEKNSADPSTRRIWSIGAALVEGLANGGIDSSVSIKMLLGHVDRSIKQLIDQGEDVFARSVSSELLKNLLYYIARIDKDSQRVNAIKALYHLDDLLPGDKELEEARSGLGGLNTELLKTVSQGIREELLEVKDILELFVHSEARDITRLSTLPDLLNKIADTLAMLGLGGPREDVITQRKKIESLVDGSIDASEDEIMEIASVLLNVEAQLNNFIANRSIQGAGPETELETDMPEGEYRDVVSAVVREALQDFSDARQAILGFLEDPSNTDLLKIVLTRLEQVNGAMFMMPVQHIESEIHALRDYIIKVLLNAGEVPDATMQDRMADVVTGIEYYLESIIEGRPRSLESSEIAARALDEVSAGYADVDEMELLAPAEEPTPEKTKEPVQASVVEAEKPAPASAVEKPATAPSALDKGYVILGDDADEEILEIFIEEALEELASLNEQFPRWKNNVADEEALTTIRRSFHTLKGSGRLIGAELIGEFAWNFENMLNRVLDKSRPADQDVFDVLEEALGVLPQLIEQLTGNREPVENVYELMARADALGKWSKTDRAKVSEAATSPTVKPEKNEVVPESAETFEDSIDELKVEPEISFPEPEEPAIEAEPETELPLMDVDDGVIDISAMEAENDEISLGGFDIEEPTSDASLDDDFDIDLTDDLESLQLAMSPSDSEPEITESETDLTEDNAIEVDGLEFVAEDLVPENYEPEAEADINVDPVLFQIFKDESEGHLKQIRLLLDKHYQGEQRLVAGPELNRALHTLFGSARTAEVQAIAEICGEAEKYVRLYQDMDSNIIQDEGVSLIDDLSQSVSSMLELMSDPGKRLQSDTTLLSRIQSEIEKLSHQLETQAVAPSPMMEEMAIEQPAEEIVTEVVAESKPAAQPEVVESLVSYGDVDDELVDIFLEEAEELLDACENCLQRWSSNSSDTESVQDLQRQLHTLKGGARMADLTPIGNLTHALESLIIAVTEGRVNFSKDMDNILHESMDNLSDMLAKVKTREPMSSAERLISLLEALKRGEAVDLKKNELDREEVSVEAQDVVEQEQPLEDFSIEFEDEAATGDTLVFDESELDLTTEVPAVDESFEIELEPTAEVKLEVEEPQIDDQADEIELDLNEFIKQEDKAAKERMQKAAEQEVVKSKDEPAKSGTQEQVRVRAELLNELVNNAGEVSVYHARMNQQIAGFSFSLTEMEQTVERLREQLRKLSIETEAQILSRYEKESDQYDADFDPLEMDRFSTMQQISRSLQETVSDIESIKDILGESVRDAETLLLQESRVSTELQEGLMRTRMVHFGGLASRLRRIVRQTARELDKDVELDISGESSEVDRTVLDRIIAPLEHMLRNAVSHGIESPEQRLAAGKSESGKITIGVDREGGDVVIKVDDDGRGIDVKAVRDKAIAQGLMERDSQLTDHEILQFIMHAGFSTAEKVTQISGRGVGMDVVDSEIKQLGGLLEIDTAQGKGSTFKIRLPLTLAINHALMVSAGEEVYAVPLNSIEGVVRLSGPELQMFYDSDNSKYEFAGVKYELRHLGKMLTGTQPDYSRSGQLFPVLLAHVGDHYVALHVDDLLGRREIVVKPVGSQIGNVRSISGATILGDGRVVLILEMNSLVLGDSLIHIEETEGLADQAAVTQVPVAETREPIVMVVDDSITIRKVTERMLGRHNMKVITAKDGVDAVAQLQDVKPDVMLLDIEMPRMDGYEVASHVRNEERLKDLPIIMITSRSGAKHKDKAFEIGVNKYLGKPYQEDELMENIHELIG